MESCSCTANEAVTIMDEIIDRTGRSAEDVVTALLTQSRRAEVLRVILTNSQ